ncbi:AI-2E family transporter [Fulvivirgaceae bacterium BMA10]|uniref:AI-2E family transporter n=1 Tax=Splendidivirga corallicola TaxID=3051826 RepID=A0ABT8KHX0_9BACT|nr:AI-2E family transporter [Fulvivirgaceae bacterium BMA10]
MENNIKTIKNTLLVFLGIVVAYLISVLSNILIPLALALFFAILLQPILAWFERKKWPFGLSLIVIYVTSLGTVSLIGMLIYQTGVSLVKQKEKLLGQINVKLHGILNWFEGLSGIQIQSSDITETLSQMMSTDWIIKSSGTLAGFLGDFTGVFVMTSLYLVAFLGGILKYEQYIHYLEEGNDIKESNILKGFEQVKGSIVTYIKIKFFMSLLTGLGYGVTCWLFGIDFALFWGFLAFILNFIPTVGSIVATVPPILLGLIQVDSAGALIALLLVLIGIQLFFGNVLEPRLMGSSLSLNTVAVIFGLVFWGYLWGVTGMILSVPLLVLIKVILVQIPDANLLVRLMGSSKVISDEPPATTD